MKEIDISYLNNSSVSSLADALKVSMEGLRVRFGDVVCCPHHIVPIYALIDYYRSLGNKIEISFESLSDVAKIFQKGNLERPFGVVWRFENQHILLDLFNATQKEILKLPSVGKGFKNAFGWCISEVMDNVLQHSQEKHSQAAVGYMMTQYVPNERLLKCCVFDLGIGLFKSFQGTKYKPLTPVEAVALAVQPNVTSGNGQGNGLYGLREIVKQSKHGRLEIKSAGGRYLFDNGIEHTDTTAFIPGFQGTTSVDFQMYLDNEFSIDSVFPDQVHSVDLWMEDHEVGDDAIRLKVLEIVEGTVARDLGKEMRCAVENIIENEHKRVIIDFSGVEMCSSAFVDELVGKLVEKYQFVRFSQFVDFANVLGLPALLIDHSIRQRLSEQQKAVEINDSYGHTCLGATGPSPEPIAPSPIGEIRRGGSNIVEAK